MGSKGGGQLSPTRRMRTRISFSSREDGKEISFSLKEGGEGVIIERAKCSKDEEEGAASTKCRLHVAYGP